MSGLDGNKKKLLVSRPKRLGLVFRFFFFNLNKSTINYNKEFFFISVPNIPVVVKMSHSITTRES
jgi:hypothetical protein